MDLMDKIGPLPKRAKPDQTAEHLRELISQERCREHPIGNRMRDNFELAVVVSSDVALMLHASAEPPVARKSGEYYFCDTEVIVSKPQKQAWRFMWKPKF